ncbi:MAG: hypothetical protein JSR48_10800 [Verrucomicrobia bacterium]|nr:hypothetical protein [Verrucomicrobiota bacterium]
MTLLLTWLVVSVVLAAPGAAADRWLSRHGVTDPRIRVAGPLAAAGAVGLLAFFAYFVHPWLGRAVAVIVPLASALHVWRNRASRTDADLRAAALLAAGVGLFYLALLYLPELHREPEWQSQVRFLYEFPIDANLPKMLGDRVYDGTPPKPFLPEAGWLSSDRPPLQAGLYLVARPWGDALGLPPGLLYQCVGTLAQLCWLPALWLLGRRLGFAPGRCAALVLLATASGLLLFNGTYVWPKLLAAGYALVAAILLLDRSAPRSAPVVALAGACAGLAWLAHGAVAFTLVPLAAMLLLPGLFPGWRAVALGAAAFALVIAPWSAYQTFYDPPANRLLKWHLAGAIDVDQRTTWQALRDGYAGLSREALVANKRANYGTLFNGSFRPAFDVFTTPAYGRKVDEFFYVFRSLGVLNLAWLLAPLAWLVRRERPGGLLGALLAVTALTLVFWPAAMFIPASTILHQSSYAMMLGLLGLAIVLLLRLPAWLGLPVLGWHALGFALTWLPYYGSAPLRPDMGILLGLATLLVAGSARALARPETPAVPAWIALAWQRVRTRPAGACLVTLAAVVGVLFLRRPEAFLHPQFWAEDGGVFFRSADLDGANAIIQPYGGYHHLLLRLVAAAASGLDPRWIPATYFWASLALTVGLAALVFSPRLALPVRPAFALAIVLVPHTGEVFNNLTNAQWIGALGLVLLLLMKDPDRPWRLAADAVMAVGLGLTGLFSALFAPLFLVRAWYRRSRAAWTLAGLVIAAAVVQAFTYARTAAPTVGGEKSVLVSLAEIGPRFWDGLLLAPTVADAVPHGLGLALAILCTAGLAAAGRDQTGHRAERWMLWCCLLLTAGATVVKFRGNPGLLASIANGDRYFYLPKVLLLWLLLLELDGPRRVWARAALSLALLASLAAFRFTPYTEYDWPSWAARLRAGQPLVVPVNPPGSSFTHPGKRPPGND